MKKIVMAITLILVTNSANAVSISSGSTFDMYDPTGALISSDPNISGFVDQDTGTWDIHPLSWFPNWSAHDGILYGEGTYSIDTIQGGVYDVTVGSGQIGGHILLNWGVTTDIDVINVWDVAGGVYTSTDVDGDGILGLGMIDGAFPGFNANFNLTTVPVPAAVWLFGSGLLALVGVARRRKAA